MSINIGKIIPIAVAVLGIAAVVVTPTFAVTSDASNTTVTVEVDKIIAISSNSSLANIAANAGGEEATQSHTITTATNSANGYALTLSMKSDVGDKGNYLVHSSYTSGTPAEADRFNPTTSAQQNLANGTWGYKLSSGNYNPVPLSGNAATIPGTSNIPTDSDAITVTYGAKASASQKSGTYTNQVTYTATVNN